MEQDNGYPELSGLFDIDENKIPNKPIAAKKERREIKEKILTSPEGDRFLPEREREKKRRHDKEQKREQLKKRIRLKTLLILIFAAALILTAAIAGYMLREMKKPEIRTAKAQITTVERSYTGSAVVIKDSGEVMAVMIDNDYDVHFIEKGQPVAAYDAAGNEYSGEVTAIKEEKTDSALFSRITSALLGEAPEISVYSVYAVLKDAGELISDSTLRLRVITETAEKAVAVPTQALYSDADQYYVWIYHPLRRIITRQDVAPGISGGGLTEIIRGLSKGDRVLTYSSCTERELYDGIPVKSE